MKRLRPGRCAAIALAGTLAALVCASCGGAPSRARGAPITGWKGFGPGQWPRASWRPYSPRSPFNVPISARDRVHAGSSRMIRRVLSWGKPAHFAAGLADTHYDYGHPFYFSRRGDPVVRLHPTEPWGPNPIRGRRIPVPAAARPAAGADAHMTIVTPDGWEYDLWNVQRNRDGGTLRFGWGGRLRINGDGLGGGGTAAGFGSLAGVIRASELRAGRIDHALFVVLRCTGNGARFGHRLHRHAGTSGWVYPARNGGTRCPRGQTDAPPMGARIALAMSPRHIDRLHVAEWKKTILRALARYGGYVGDTGGTGIGFQFESGSSYTSFGHRDPMVAFARRHHMVGHDGIYQFDVAAGVPWQRLRVLTPPRRARHR